MAVRRQPGPPAPTLSHPPLAESSGSEKARPSLYPLPATVYMGMSLFCRGRNSLTFPDTKTSRDPGSRGTGGQKLAGHGPRDF